MLTTGSGILPEVIDERGYRSVLPPEGYAILKPHKFTREQANLPGLLLPVWTTDRSNGLMVYRPDTPRLGKDGKPIKYEFPRNAGVRLDCPPRCQAKLADPSIPLWITEGEKKADALVSHGLCAIALLGVWNFKGRNPFGGTTLLANFDHIACGSYACLRDLADYGGTLAIDDAEQLSDPKRTDPDKRALLPYQDERPELESADLQVLVIKALCHYATSATRATNTEGG
jgi:Domain of unknown function (DUF3854)